nr:MAG TPA: translation initiation factor-like protein [Caudoviricetes sp.]DAQ99762.1 MAG TPA: translation initiation factor-like protein [Caudoviricetes sp.]DAX13862.1 MAG TPA: translation initiation factor-like protein [Bacteriophage sp.]
MVIKINKIFNSLDEVYECYGRENIIPITQLPQIIFYTSKWHVQPKWTEESERNPGHLCCFFHKGETKKCYEEWMKNRPNKGGD